jgi:hypothetical protein
MKLRIAHHCLTGLALVTLISISACQKVERRHHNLQRQSVAVRHWSDGRYAYQDDSGVWWWYVYSANGATTRADGSLTMPGIWSQGRAPTDIDLADSATVNESIVTDNGAPTSADENVASSEAEAGGGGSEASAGPSDSSPSVSSDSGGGGGDSGGGGDGGGGSGD